MKKLKQQSFEVNFSSLLTAFDMRNSLALTNNRFHVEVTVRNKKIPHSFFSRKLSFFFSFSLSISLSLFLTTTRRKKSCTRKLIHSARALRVISLISKLQNVYEIPASLMIAVQKVKKGRKCLHINCYYSNFCLLVIYSAFNIPWMYNEPIHRRFFFF